jgi:hypothetical protein
MELNGKQYILKLTLIIFVNDAVINHNQRSNKIEREGGGCIEAHGYLRHVIEN